MLSENQANGRQKKQRKENRREKGKRKRREKGKGNTTFFCVKIRNG